MASDGGDRRLLSKDEFVTTDMHPIIVGGGLAGLAAALALHRLAGISSQVLELERSPGNEFFDFRAGAGAQLGPNGLRALRAIGGDDLMRRVLDAGSVLRGNVALVNDGNGNGNGVTKPSEPMVFPDTAEDDTGLPQIFVRWGVLQSLLSDALPDDCIRTGVGGCIRGYRVIPDDYKEEERDDGGRRLPQQRRLQLVDELGEDLDHPFANLIVGAEGVASVFRYLVNTDRRTVPRDVPTAAAAREHVRDTGRVNVKAVVPTELDPDRYLANHTYAWFAPNGSGVGCFAGPAGPGYTYWAVSVADDGGTTSTESSSAVVPFLSNPDDGHDGDDVKEALLSKLGGLDGIETSCPFILDLIRETAPGTIHVSRSEEGTGVGPSLQKDGHVVLVGDAAHAMSLSYGQQPNFALEDAAILGVCLRDYAFGDDPTHASSEGVGGVEEALRAYSRSRVARCLEMQRRSAERATKAMRGEQAEDVSKWIFQWDLRNEAIGGRGDR